MSRPRLIGGGEGPWGNQGFPHAETAREVRFLDV